MPPLYQLRMHRDDSSLSVVARIRVRASRPSLGAALLVVLVGLLGAPSAAAQATLSDRAEVSLLTILPGDALYSAYGHSALRVHDPAQGLDVLYNYGTFDFTPLFAFEFAYGRLDYLLSVQPTRRALPHYRAEGRPVIEQVLALTPAQRRAVYRALEINALPQNRVYRYDFFFDNCSTRIRDLLAEVLGADARFDFVPPASLSFRALIDPYHGAFLDVGLDLLLGAPTDREATPWEMMFLPDLLMQGADASMVRHGDTWRPLVARQDTLLTVEGYRRGTARPWAALLFWLLALAGIALTLWQAVQDRALPRLPDVVLFATVGGAGLIVLFLWFVSLHAVTEANWNLVWLWPTHAAAAWLLARHQGGRRLQRYFRTAAVVTLLVAAAWWLWPQNLPGAALPLALLTAARAAWFGFAPAALTRRPADMRVLRRTAPTTP